jgi:hypothetical protein
VPAAQLKHETPLLEYEPPLHATQLLRSPLDCVPGAHEPQFAQPALLE